MANVNTLNANGVNYPIEDETARANAQSALSTANTAQTTAQNAQNTADSAQTTADNAVATVSNLQEKVNELSNSLADQIGSFTFKTLNRGSSANGYRISPYGNNLAIVINRFGYAIIYVSSGSAFVRNNMSSSTYEISAEVSGNDLIITSSADTRHMFIVPYSCTITAE